MHRQDEKLRSLIAEQAAQWHVAQQDGELDPEQARAFMHWLRTSPMHVAEYLAITGIAQDMADAAGAISTSLEELLVAEEETIQSLPLDAAEQEGIAGMPSPRAYRARARRRVQVDGHRRRPLRRVAAAGAVLAVVLVVVVVGLHWLAPSPDVRTYVAQRGEVRSLQLPDNTLVKLDAESAMTIRFDGRARRVTVERGQAWFEVAKDPARPFSVRAGPSLIRDIGTAFDVYRRKSGTTIAVAHGRVQVWNAPPATQASSSWLPWARQPDAAAGKLLATLDTGQQARVAPSGQLASRGTFDVQQLLAWTKGRIAFDNRPVTAVAAEFNRYNNVQIEVRDPSIGALPISGMFDAHDVATFIAFLESMPNVRVEKYGRRFIITARHPSHPSHQGSAG